MTSHYFIKLITKFCSVSKVNYSNNINNKDDNNNKDSNNNNFDSIFPGATSLALQNSMQSQLLTCDVVEVNTYSSFDLSAPSMNSSFLGTKVTYNPNQINESIESIEMSEKSAESNSENILPEDDGEYDSICYDSELNFNRINCNLQVCIYSMEIFVFQIQRIIMNVVQF